MPRGKRHYRVTLSEAIVAHEFALVFGGLAGIRDQGLVEAAIARPYCGYYRSIASKAAALVHSLALNHGFIDGNKRTALFMVSLLLRKSGYELRHENEQDANRDAEAMIIAIVEHRMSFEELVSWFRDRIVPL